MRVFENDSPIVNIRARGFDFDDDKPVQGITMDEDRAKAWEFFYGKAVHNLTAVIVVLGGWWLMKFWFYGGHHLMRSLYAKGAGWLLLLVEHGLFMG